MPSWKVIQGDAVDELSKLDENSVDLILTDPPYFKQFIHLYGEVAAVGAKILKPGGSFVAIAPHYVLPRVIADCSSHLRWHWIIDMCQLKYERQARIVQYGVYVSHKPIIWLTKGYRPIKGRQTVADAFNAFSGKLMGQVKKHHPLAQPLTFPEHCIRIAMPAPGLVVDPFVGSGGCGVVAIKHGFDFIGIDVDPECVRISREQIRQAADQNIAYEESSEGEKKDVVEQLSLSYDPPAAEAI
jgi:DNA modification methylase